MAENKTSTTQAKRKSAPKTGKKVTKVSGRKAKPKKQSTTASKKIASTSKSVAVQESPEVNRFAVIKLAGTQLIVVEGGKYTVRKIEGKKGETIVSKDVLLISENGDVKFGNPTVSGATVTYTIDSQKKGRKLEIFKYKAKSRYRRRYGDRPLITRILVTKIEG